MFFASNFERKRTLLAQKFNFKNFIVAKFILVKFV